LPTAPLPQRRARVTAPAGATQAEFRFQVPAGNFAAISQASLVGAPGPLANSELNTLVAGKPDGWTLKAPQPAAVTFVDTGTSVQVKNGGSGSADLFQTVTVKSGNQFVLGLHAVAIPPANPDNSTTQNARLELRWLDAAKAAVLPSPGLDILFPTRRGRVCVRDRLAAGGRRIRTISTAKPAIAALAA